MTKLLDLSPVTPDQASPAPKRCTTCALLEGVNGTSMKRCDRCKLVWYCSKECQRTGWPTHKKICGDDLGKGIGRLVKRALEDPLINAHIQIALALHLQVDGKLPPDDQNIWARDPFFAHFDIGVEPCDIEDMRRLAKNPYSWDYTGVKGMLQFYMFNTYPTSTAEQTEMAQQPPAIEPLASSSSLASTEQSQRGEFVAFPPTFGATLRDARLYADSQEGGSNWPVVLTTFANAEKQMVGMAIIVTPRAIEIVRNKEAYRIHMPQVGYSYEHSSFLTLPQIISQINLHIRADINNTLRLRQPIRELDVQLIRNCLHAEELHSRHSQVLDMKYKREEIYKVQRPVLAPFPLLIMMGIFPDTQRVAPHPGGWFGTEGLLE